MSVWEWITQKIVINDFKYTCVHLLVHLKHFIFNINYQTIDIMFQYLCHMLKVFLSCYIYYLHNLTVLKGVYLSLTSLIYLPCSNLLWFVQVIHSYKDIGEVSIKCVQVVGSCWIKFKGAICHFSLLKGAKCILVKGFGYIKPLTSSLSASPCKPKVCACACVLHLKLCLCLD